MPSLQVDFLYAQENTPSHYPVKCSTNSQEREVVWGLYLVGLGLKLTEPLPEHEIRHI